MNERRRVALGGLLMGLLAGACGATEVAVQVNETHRAQVEAWRQQREERLRKPESWLSLVGLSWLSEGDNAVGSASASAVELPKDRAAPAVGTMTLRSGKVSFRAAEGAAVSIAGKPVREAALAPDTSGEPTVLEIGSLRLYVIQRGARLGVRVKDRESPLFKTFHGMENYPIDPTWRVVARWEAYLPVKQIAVPNVLGAIENSPCPGAAVFERDGRTFRLEPILEEGSDELFFIFGDQTNRQETYGGGRFLYAAKAAADGTVVLDFNRAYNPPCVFTPYATCPLPPPQNKLALRIEAGEKKFTGGSGH
jgi:uncharacterized protein (DUF1684 family)